MNPVVPTLLRIGELEFEASESTRRSLTWGVHAMNGYFSATHAIKREKPTVLYDPPATLSADIY